MEIISRKEAASRGLARYFTGKRCRNGHLAERYIGNGVCVTCNYENSIEYRAMLKKLIKEARC